MLKSGKKINKMIDKIIRAFFSLVTAIMMVFYTPTPVTQVNPETLPEAIKASYGLVEKIHFDNAFYRNDIGAKALKVLKEGK